MTARRAVVVDVVPAILRLAETAVAQLAVSSSPDDQALALELDRWVHGAGAR